MEQVTGEATLDRMAAHGVAQVRDVVDRLLSELGEQLVGLAQCPRARTARFADSDVLANGQRHVGRQLRRELGDEQLGLERTL